MIVLAALFRFSAKHLSDYTNDAALIEWNRGINVFLSQFRIGCMAIGGLGAWLLFYQKEKVLSFVYRKDVQGFTLLAIVALYLANPIIPLAKHECCSVLFVILILNLASNPNSLLKLESPALNFLGKISYGIYMYHPLVIGLVIGLLEYVKLDVYLFHVLLYVMTIGLTIGVASVSFLFLKKEL